MIIFGTNIIETVIKTGTFHCPNCRTERNYRLKRDNRYFHLFFVPLFKSDSLDDSLDCTFCRTSYIPGTVLPENEYTRTNPLGSTSTNSTLGLTPSSIRKRIGALFIDSVLIGILALLLSLLKLESLFFVLFFAYFFICDIIFKGSSIGKKILSMQVSEYEEKEQPSVIKLFVRSLIKSICFYFPLIYFFALLNEDYQALHDKAVKTMVIDY